MTTLDLKDIQESDFSTATSFENSVILVRMKGNWDMKAVAPLDVFTRALQAETERLRLGQVVVHLDDVEFFNSSCLKSFARWVGSLSKLAEADRYTITFHTSQPWQRRSLEALKALARDRVTVEP